MGAGQLKNANTIKINMNNVNTSDSRFMSEAYALKFHQNRGDKLRIQPFKRLLGWELQLEGITVISPDSTILTSQIYFPDMPSLDAYLGYMVSLKQICHLNIYDDFQLQTQKTPFFITTRQQLSGIPKPIDKIQLQKNVEKFLHLLVFVSEIITKAENIFIVPEDLVQINNQFYLRGFLQKECSRKKLIMAYIIWLFEQYEHFEDCLNIDNTISSFNTLDRYIKQIFYTIKNNRIDDDDLVKYFKNVNDKMKYLEGGFDSFHVCYRSKRQRYNTNITRDWLVAKKSNEVYFFNINDEHVCQGRIMRKAKKISVEQTHIVFNSTDFEVNFMLEGTKNMVKTTELELEDCFTISDIQIKFKFPFRIRNPLMFLRGREIYMLDQLIYRYSIDQNKIYQQSKKINDSLYLVPSVDQNYIVIRHSIDIFRYGIKIYTADRYDTLMPSGNAEMAGVMESIKIDIRHIQFCCEVYKGVYLMLSDKNFWILDLNFMCFFSYTPLERIQSLYKGKGSDLESNDYMFETLGQPFSMNWLSHQHGLNVHAQQDTLHVIASVTGKLFYLQYRFIFEAGLLKLLKCRPLYQEEGVSNQIEDLPAKSKESYFNVYNESMQVYKNTSWIHKGPIFLEVRKLKMALCKNFTQIFVQTDDMLKNIKDIIDQNKKSEQKWSKFEITIILYKLLSMISYLNQNNIAYKNFNLSNLWITARRQLKLAGWSEPQRNWHISDFKDYLLACFCIISQTNYEKLNDKFLQKHEAELELFPVLREKMQTSIRNKMPEKKIEVEKQLISIKESLNQGVYSFIQPFKSSNFIFSFEHNTPRFSMLSISEGKIKKMIAIIQSHNTHEQFTFKQTDEYAWNEKEGCLYVLTITYQMYEIKPNLEDMKEETIVIEEYEYLPKNIISSSFISCSNGLYAFGGISRNSKKKVHYNLNVYHFNRSKLTWEAVAQLDSARVKPSLVLSESGKQIYVMSGELDTGSDELVIFVFDTTANTVEKKIDLGLANPFKKLTEKQSFKVFQLSEAYKIFLMWSVNATSYQFKLFSSLIAGFEIDFEGKIYMEEGAELAPISIAFAEGAIHFLRPYGKYSKITIEGLENPKITNKTLYSN